VVSTAEETDMDVPREIRGKDRSGEVEEGIIFCDNETCEGTKERWEEYHESYPGSLSKI